MPLNLVLICFAGSLVLSVCVLHVSWLFCRRVLWYRLFWYCCWLFVVSYLCFCFCFVLICCWTRVSLFVTVVVVDLLCSDLLIVDFIVCVVRGLNFGLVVVYNLLILACIACLLTGWKACRFCLLGYFVEWFCRWFVLLSGCYHLDGWFPLFASFVGLSVDCVVCISLTWVCFVFFGFGLLVWCFVCLFFVYCCYLDFNSIRSFISCIVVIYY